MDDSDPVLYPNADGASERTARLSRRGLLAGSAAAGAVATAGCLDDDGDDPNVEEEPTVFVFNTDDGTVSVIDAAADELLETRSLGVTSSFPSNQYAPELTDGADDPLWLNVDRGVRAFAVGSLSETAAVGTGSGANWLEQTPDGAHLVVSAREPAHAQFRIDADPDSGTFGEVTGEIDRTPEGGRGDEDGPGPCDVTVHPGGRYAYVPDLFGDTLTVLDVEAFEIETQVEVPPVGDGPAAPWMGAAARDGETMLVEHDEGPTGTESVWDVSDPADPEELARLTADDGFGKRPLTSEIGPDAETGYVFTPGSEDVTVVDLQAREVAGRIDLGGSAFVGTWGPDHETLYVPVQTTDEVAVIDHGDRAVATRIPVGPSPYGATAATVRPAAEESPLAAMAARLRFATGDAGTAYCIGNCACGHRL
jgi:YVTN family beta-propeller protein